MNQPLGESQRDSVSKPRVARNELPWEQRASEIQPHRGCGFWRTAAGFSTCKQGSVPHNHIFLVTLFPFSWRFPCCCEVSQFNLARTGLRISIASCERSY